MEKLLHHPSALLILTYGSLDAMDGVLLRIDPVSDVSLGADEGWWGRGYKFSRELDLDESKRWYGEEWWGVLNQRAKGEGKIVACNLKNEVTKDSLKLMEDCVCLYRQAQSWRISVHFT